MKTDARGVLRVVCAALAVALAGCGEPMNTPDGGSAAGGTSAGGSAGGASAGGSAGGASAGGSAGGASAGGMAGGSAGGMAGGTAGGAALGDIVAVASSNQDFSILVQAVQRAGLVSALQAATPRKTVFAPNNAAFTRLFAALGVNGVNDLSVDQLTVVLKYHVLATEVNAAAATTAAMANTRVSSLGGQIQLSLASGMIRLDGASTVTAPDVMASNGIIHGISEVILPSLLDVATTDPRFSSLAAAVTAANQPAFVAQLDNNATSPKLTVFAPTNAGFDALVGALRGTDDGGTTGINSLGSFSAGQLGPVLGYHVLPAQVLAAQVPASGVVDSLGGKLAVTRVGSVVTVDGVQVAIPDIRTANGVIHAIPQVLLPTIADVVQGPINTFVGLSGALALADSLPDGGTNPSGLIGALDGTRPDGGGYTVFAPTNAAFNSLVATLRGNTDGGTTGINALSSFSVPQVTPVLKYHVAPATVYASQIPTTATNVSTLGGTASAQRTGSGVTIDGANVVIGNIFAKNGVVHVIDRVILPSIADVVTTDPSFTGLASLVASAPAVGTALDGTTNFTLFAPSNTAVAAVTSPPTGQALANLLLFHAGTSVGTTQSPIYASTVLALPMAVDLSTALTGRTLRVGPVSSTVRVAPNPASGPSPALTTSSIRVTQPNLFTSNGVIHVIDGVLVP